MGIAVVVIPKIEYCNDFNSEHIAIGLSKNVMTSQRRETVFWTSDCASRLCLEIVKAVKGFVNITRVAVT